MEKEETLGISHMLFQTQMNKLLVNLVSLIWKNITLKRIQMQFILAKIKTPLKVEWVTCMLIKMAQFSMGI